MDVRTAIPFAINTETVEFDRYGRKCYFLNSSVSTIENDCVVSTWVSQIEITELREAQQAQFTSRTRAMPSASFAIAKIRNSQHRTTAGS